ncbi:hypothetical protein CHS0354_023309 [Potamilus streckersoni]|uniref:ubiquitinyl hydrolase 1 n=1 Tax=Potamilus streckersoni TaxID=2493646 RepID=A0AAE0W6B1_9BIVA|nr:hypothetical protein CHS0354_023309 [Potamilus streckersoni]
MVFLGRLRDTVACVSHCCFQETIDDDVDDTVDDDDDYDDDMEWHGTPEPAIFQLFEPVATFSVRLFDEREFPSHYVSKRKKCTYKILKKKNEATDLSAKNAVSGCAHVRKSINFASMKRGLQKQVFGQCEVMYKSDTLVKAITVYKSDTLVNAFAVYKSDTFVNAFAVYKSDTLVNAFAVYKSDTLVNAFAVYKSDTLVNAITVYKSDTLGCADEALSSMETFFMSETTTIYVCLQCGCQFHFLRYQPVANTAAKELEDEVIFLAVVGCGISSPRRHASRHAKDSTSHALAINTTSWIVWCNECRVPNVDSFKGRNGSLTQKVTTWIGDIYTACFCKASVVVVNQAAHTASVPAASFNVDSSQESKGPLGQKVMGLRNVGNTCFFNAAMQNLIQTYSLENLLMERIEGGPLFLPGSDNSSTCSRDEDDYIMNLPSIRISLSKARPVTMELANFLQEIKSAPQTNVVNPSDLFEEVCREAPMFRGHQQHDSHELLSHMLDIMRSEEIKRGQVAVLKYFELVVNSDPQTIDHDVRMKVRQYGRQVKHTFVDALFGGCLVSTVMCEECQYISQTLEPFLNLSLPVQEEKTTLGQQLSCCKCNHTVASLNLVVWFVCTSVHSSGRSKEGEGHLLPHLMMMSSMACLYNIGLVERKNECEEEESDREAKEVIINVEEEEGNREGDVKEDIVAMLGDMDGKGGDREVDVNEDFQPVELENKCEKEERDREEDVKVEKKKIGLEEEGGSVHDLNKYIIFEEGVYESKEEGNRMADVMQEWKKEDAEEGYNMDAKDASVIYNLMPSGDALWETGDADGPNKESPIANGEMHKSKVTVHAEYMNGTIVNGYLVSDDTSSEEPMELEAAASSIMLSSSSYKHLDTGEQVISDVTSGTNTSSVSETGSSGFSQELSLNMLYQSSEESEKVKDSDVPVNSSQSHVSDDTGISTQGTGSMDSATVGNNESPLKAGNDEDVSISFNVQHLKPSEFEDPQPVRSRKEIWREGKRKSVSTLAPRYQSTSSECSLESCLSLFTSPELLTGNNKFGCKNCTKLKKKSNPNTEIKTVYSDASKKYLIIQPPAVLTLHFKRFEQFNIKKISKLDCHVDFPFVLDLAPYCSALCQNVKAGQKKILYSLYGVVEHKGSLKYGHYTAYVKVRPNINTQTNFLSTHQVSVKEYLDQYTENVLKMGEKMEEEMEEDNVSEIMVPSGQWFHISDSHVSKVTEATVKHAQAYMLFYERIY